MTQDEKDRLCRRIVDHAGDALIFADRDGIIRLWNRAAEGIFGFTEAEAVGQPLARMIPGHRHGVGRTGRGTATLDGFPEYGSDVQSARSATKDGERIAIEYTIRLLRDRTGKSLGTVAVVRDETARQRRETSLRAKLAFLAAGQTAA